MSTISSPRPQTGSMKDPALMAELQKLRQTDNWRNILYLMRTWLILGVAIGSAVAFDLARQEAGWGWYWSIPVFATAIVIIGAGQHQLTGLAHEASHHTLLKHRYLNDLVSDWLCMFPMFSSTHHYRLQHMAHHQFVNDPDRDPDVSQLKTSGHWMNFPLSRGEFVRRLVGQLWVPRLIKYIRVRAQYNSMGTTKNPYLKPGVKQSKLPVRVGILYLLSFIGLTTSLVWAQATTLLYILPAVLWASAMLFYAFIPEGLFHQSRVHPVISARHMTLMRITFNSLLFWSLAWIQHTTGARAGVYFILLWVVPILTSFSFFMILRQLVQHGNGDRGFMTNTRTFFVHPFIRYAVFPFGQDYHLPHHMYATVPHYRLKRLHEILSQYPEYQEKAVVVEGYFLPKENPPSRPTVLDVIGPQYRYDGAEIHIDNSVLEMDRVDD